MTDSDEALVVRSRNGERPAFEELVGRTGRLVFVRLLLETGDAHRAEDLTQETFLAAWRGIRQVQDPKAFRPWLLSIAQRVQLDAWRREGARKRRGRHVGDDAMAGLADPSPGPVQAAETSEARQRLLKALKELPEQYRQPLALRYLAGADYQTIERQLALSNGSLRGLLNRGMVMLREAMTARPS